MHDRVRAAWGVIRALQVYYGDRTRMTAMQQLYARFVHKGDLVFDIGALVGERIAAFRKLGARVVAVEPQPAPARLIRLLYGRDPAVMLECVAVGRDTGTIALQINVEKPAVSTASTAFVRAALAAPGWEGQTWSKTVRVPATTLDALIARHGMPAFVKIDVEGFEAEVLAGLSRPCAALSFEFTTIQRDVALACLERCRALGYARFNAAMGESQTLVNPQWVEAAVIGRWLTELPHAANSGDIYAVLS